MLNWFKKQSPEDVEPKTLGQIGEELAQREYVKIGCEIIAANFFNKKGLRLGEIDFIAKKGRQLMFVEVKTRTFEKDRFGTAAESVDCHKQVKLLKAVKLFLLRNQEYLACKPQIDVCAVIIKDFSQLALKDIKPDRYALAVPIDKFKSYVTIIPNAVEDWN